MSRGKVAPVGLSDLILSHIATGAEPTTAHLLIERFGNEIAVRACVQELKKLNKVKLVKRKLIEGHEDTSLYWIVVPGVHEPPEDYEASEEDLEAPEEAPELDGSIPFPIQLDQASEVPAGVLHHINEVRRHLDIIEEAWNERSLEKEFELVERVTQEVLGRINDTDRDSETGA